MRGNAETLATPSFFDSSQQMMRTQTPIMASSREPPRSAVDDAPTRVQNPLSKGNMTTPAKRHSIVNQERSAKRRKTDHEEIQYSDREITWDEQLRLPARFREAEGVWPARRILKERKTGLKKEYLVDWEPHPETGEIFRPTWVSHISHILPEPRLTRL